MRIYLYQLSYSTVYLYILVTWCCCCSRCCSPVWPQWKEKRRNLFFYKFPEPNNRLGNHHGPMEAQGFRSQKELPQKVFFDQLFRLILFEITSYQFILWFRLKYIRVFYMGCAFALHCTKQENRMQVFWETFSEIKLKVEKALMAQNAKIKNETHHNSQTSLYSIWKKYYNTDKFYKCFTYEKTNMAAAHLWIHGFIVSMKDNQKQFSSHYTKILPESKKKKKKKKPHTENNAPKTKAKKAKERHKTKPKIAHKDTKTKNK